MDDQLLDGVEGRDPLFGAARIEPQRLIRAPACPRDHRRLLGRGDNRTDSARAACGAAVEGEDGQRTDRPVRGEANKSGSAREEDLAVCFAVPTLLADLVALDDHRRAERRTVAERDRDLGVGIASPMQSDVRGRDWQLDDAFAGELDPHLRGRGLRRPAGGGWDGGKRRNEKCRRHEREQGTTNGWARHHETSAAIGRVKVWQLLTPRATIACRAESPLTA